MARKSSPAKTVKKPSKAANGKKMKKTVGSTGLKDKAAVAKALFQHMCEEHAFGVTGWSREDLASALGFGNPRTEKFAHGLKMLMEQQGLAQKGGGKGMVELSSKGIAQKPNDVQPTSLAAIHERYLGRLEQKVACGANRVRPLWKILEDRKAHTIDEIANKLGYTNKRSFMNTKVIALMETMGLVTKKDSKVTMTDKAFPVVS